jgi:hypothetical protein
LSETSFWTSLADWGWSAIGLLSRLDRVPRPIGVGTI